MKQLILSLISLATFSGIAQQDIVVNGSGLPGTYSSISEAVQAASPGDKILVSNQAFPYQEDTLFIDKDLTIMPYSASSYIAFEGDIQVTLDSISDLTFIGFDSDLTTMYSIFNDTTRNSLSTVNIVDCEFKEIRLDQPKTSLYLSYSTASRVYFSHGDIIGNSISEILSLGIFRDNTWGYGTNFYRSHQNTLGDYINGYSQNVNPCGLFSGSVNFGSTETYSDTCNIIANDFTRNGGCDVTMNTTDFAFNIRNNRFKQAAVDKSLLIYQCCPSGIGTNLIVNNDLSPQNANQNYTSYYNYGVTLCLAYCADSEPSHNFRDVSMKILNNGCRQAYLVDIPQNTNYQVYNAYNLMFLGDCISAYNSTGNGHSDVSQQLFQNGPTNYDGSNPNPSMEFLNLDLSLNTNGSNGGSDAWSNYHPNGEAGFGTMTGSKARITYLNLPNQIFDPTNIQIKARAVHGN